MDHRAFAAILAFSRVIAGTHHPGDVLAESQQ
jgi:membrane-associated phospholipid phosphatase